VTAVGFGVNTNHVGNVRALNVGAVQHLLSDVVEFVGDDASLDPQRIVGLLSDDAIGDFGEPPDA
jgi:hypothetical protein